jgi:hypothetical protein
VLKWIVHNLVVSVFGHRSLLWSGGGGISMTTRGIFSMTNDTGIPLRSIPADDDHVHLDLRSE